MVYKLPGRNVLVTGSGRGLGAEIARRFASEGCNVAINDVTSSQQTIDFANKLGEDYSVKTAFIQADAGDTDECARCVRETIEVFGGIDIIIGNAGWTNYNDWNQAFATNVLGNHALFKEALPTYNSNPEGGVFITTSSIAGKTIFGSSMAYSVTKSAQLHLIKCLAGTQGPKVRVNAVLPGLMLTDWGKQVGEEAIEKMTQQATLKKPTEIEDCAEAYVSIAKNSSMNGQFMHVDSGLFVQHL